MYKNTENLDPRIITAAEIALDEFKQGERQWESYENSFAFSKGYPESTFVSSLDEVIDDEADALEFLSGVIDIGADPEKTKRILAKLELPPSEVLKVWLWELQNQSEQHIITIIFVPLELEGIEDTWVMIAESGISQEPEFWIVGIFDTEDKMKTYFEDNFET